MALTESHKLLKSSFLWLVIEEEVRDLKHKEISTGHCWLEGAGHVARTVRSREELSATKKRATSVLQLQRTEFFQEQQQKNCGNRFPLPRVSR